MSVNNCLLSTSQLLDEEQDGQLNLDVISACIHLDNPNFRIAFFGPFNHGKSTLLNALLGSRALPIKLIPTTGTAISIQYGSELETLVTLIDGSDVREKGTEILERFAVLDGKRHMREDVISIELFCPHPILKRGIELLDLPGTNDMEVQDELVFNQLLTVDLVIQVLDARKLFTLEEVKNLQEWIFDRGIKTVVFLINFLNLLDTDEQKEVVRRARSIASEFRIGLPNSIRNLYRVDALPALKARLQGDANLAFKTGIMTFESGLHHIAEILTAQIDEIRLPRAVAIANKIKQSLEAKAHKIESELIIYKYDRHQKIEQERKLAEQLKQAFQTNIDSLRNWLSLQNLLVRYQSEAASALQQEEFSSWEGGFKQALVVRQQALRKYVDQACSQFNHHKADGLSMLIFFPPHPSVSKPSPPTTTEPNLRHVAIATGIGWFLGGPVGGLLAAGATHLVNSNSKNEQVAAWEDYSNKLSQVCSDAAKDYLSCFSHQALLKLNDYESNAEKVFNFSSPEDPSDIFYQRSQLIKLQKALKDLDREFGLTKDVE